MQNFFWENECYWQENAKSFHFNCFELSLALKQRLGATPNGLFFCELTMLLRTPSGAFAMSSYRAFLW